MGALEIGTQPRIEKAGGERPGSPCRLASRTGALPRSDMGEGEITA